MNGIVNRSYRSRLFPGVAAIIETIRHQTTITTRNHNFKSSAIISTLPRSGLVLLIAILSFDEFDATTVIPETVLFAGLGIEKVGKNGKYLCHEKDTNKDGLLDLVCRIDATELVKGAEWVTVYAETSTGITIIGKEHVCIAQH